MSSYNFGIFLMKVQLIYTCDLKVFVLNYLYGVYDARR